MSVFIHHFPMDYTLFKDKPEFYAENMMMNIRNHKIFNDKFHLNVLSLNQIHLATEEDKLWSLDLWAKLFKATTWEDLKMIADNNSTMATATKVIYEYNEDELIRRQCRAREEYERHERTVNKKIQELTNELAEKDSALAEMKLQIQELKEQVQSLQNKLANS